MQFSIVIPVHNEAENILPLLGEIRQGISSEHQYEVVCVNDHSSDDTSDVLNGQLGHQTNLKVITLQGQHGQSTALRIGIQHAIYPLIVTLDGDGQNDPNDIEKLLQYFASQKSGQPPLLVIGHRTKRKDTTWRQFSSRFAYKFRKILLNDTTPDSGCGIKAFPKDFFLNFPAFNHMHRFLPALAIQSGGQVISLPVNHRGRKFGRSNYGTWDRLSAGLVDILGVRWLGKRAIRPNIQK